MPTEMYESVPEDKRPRHTVVARNDGFVLMFSVGEASPHAGAFESSAKRAVANAANGLSAFLAFLQCYPKVKEICERGGDLEAHCQSLVWHLEDLAAKARLTIRSEN